MKKTLRILAWIAGVLAAVIVLAMVGLWLFFPVEKAKNLAIEKGSAQLGRPIAVEGVQISFWGGVGVKLQKVTISNPPEFAEGYILKADNIDVKLQILPLISGDYHVSKLIINGPEIMMVKHEDGSNNYTFKAIEKKAPPEMVQQATPEAKAAAFAITFDKLEINDGMLTYIDDSSHHRIQVENLNLATRLRNPEGRLYESSGEFSVDTLRISNGMPIPPFSISLKYSGAYDLDKKFASIEDTELGINNLRFALKGEITDPFGAAKGGGTIKSQRVAVADLFKLIPREKLAALADYSIDGDFALDVGADYDKTKETALTYYGTATINGMSLSSKKIPGEFKFKRALVDFKNDNLRMNIEDGTFADKPFKGHLVVENFSDPTVNGELAGKFDLALVQPFLPQKNAHVVSGETGFDIKLSGKAKDFRTMDFSGNLTVKTGQYSSKILLEPIDTFSLDVYFDNRLISVKQFEAKSKSGSFSFEGRLNDLIPYFMADSTTRGTIEPTVDGTFKGDLNLAILNAMLPPKGNPELNGQLDVNLKLSGVITDYNRLQPRGTIAITNGSYRDSLLPEPITHFEANLGVTPDTITVNGFDIKFVSSDASFSGRLIDPFPYLLPIKTLDRSNLTKPLFLFDLSSRRFDSDKLFPEAVPGSGEDRAGVSVDSMSAVLLPDIDGRGTLKVDTLIYSKVQFTQINGKVKIYDRKIECYDVTGKVYSGDVAGTTTIDLNNFENPRYTGDFKATNVEADDFISRFSKFGGMVFGKINLDGSYNAFGWDPDAFLNSLSMNSVTSMQQGKVVASGNALTSLTELAAKAGKQMDKEQSLRDLKTNIVVKDGKVWLDKLKTNLGNIGELELDGYYAFAGNVDYKGSILLSKDWTQSLLSNKGLLGDAAGFLTDKSVDRIKLPIVMGGTIDKPSFKVDYDALGKAAGDKLKDKVDDAVNNLLNKIKK